MTFRLRSARAIPAGIALVAGLLVAAPVLRPAKAQDLSGQPIKLIVALGTDDATDLTARLAQRMGESLHAPVSVDTRPDEGLVPALGELAGAAADGHTLLLLSTSALIAQLLHPEQPVDLAALTPVTQVAAGPVILATRAGFPINVVGDVISYARTNRHRLVIAGGGGSAGTPYLAAELFKWKTGIDVALVAYKGGGPALDRLLESHIDVTFDTLPVIGPRAKTGVVKPVAVTSAERFPGLPNLPTFKEAGVADYDVVRWLGILAPANTPPAVAKRLHDEVAKALAAPDLVEELGRQGLQAVASAPEQWQAYLSREVDAYSRIVKEAGLKPE